MLKLHSEILNSPWGKDAQEPFRGITQREVDSIALRRDAELTH